MTSGVVCTPHAAVRNSGDTNASGMSCAKGSAGEEDSAEADGALASRRWRHARVVHEGVDAVEGGDDREADSRKHRPPERGREDAAPRDAFLLLMELNHLVELVLREHIQ